MRKRMSNGCRNSVAIDRSGCEGKAGGGIGIGGKARGGIPRTYRGKRSWIPGRRARGRTNNAGTHSREMREGPVDGVAPGRPVGFEERIPVLAEVLLHLSQQLVVGHAAQSVRESRRVAKIRRHRWIRIGSTVTRHTPFDLSPATIHERLHKRLRLLSFSLVRFRVAKLISLALTTHYHAHAKVRALLTNAAPTIAFERSGPHAHAHRCAHGLRKRAIKMNLHNDV